MIINDHWVFESLRIGSWLQVERLFHVAVFFGCLIIRGMVAAA